MQLADMAAAPLTHTVTRGQIVTFLQPPFMTFDLAILMKRGDRTSKIRNINQLANQRRIRYGIVDGGATKNFFRVTQTGVFPKMWSTMDSSPDISYVQSIEEGVRRVRQSTDSHPFAFIGEQYTLDYHARRKPCDLMMVKAGAPEYRERNTGEYHLAIKKVPDSDANKRNLEEALTNLKNSGRLDALYRKWWVERAQCSRAPSSAVTSGLAVLVPIVVALFRVTGE